jgi:hypothetical protein
MVSLTITTNQSINLFQSPFGIPQLFRIGTQMELELFHGSINDEKLDGCLCQLEVYITIQGFSNFYKVQGGHLNVVGVLLLCGERFSRDIVSKEGYLS